MSDSLMYGGARLQIDGYSEVLRDLYLAGADSDDLKAITRPLAERIAATGRALAPKKSGRLAASIKPKNSRVSVTVRTPARVKYAPVRHWGKDGTSGTHFLSRAEETHRAATYAGIEAGIDELLQKRNL